MIPKQPMKFNPTLPEIVLLFIVSLCIYIWTRHGRKVKQWWKELRKQ
jgi:hypothetical protein